MYLHKHTHAKHTHTHTHVHKNDNLTKIHTLSKTSEKSLNNNKQK